ncbi:hypothetical protein D4764_14G0006390 [Takifugu flavidus]|uniref:Uncharacterized protein n=1 Tax=Takifugu flavidus TaxID=433684 RepID=A0A5C6P678_9TELE|nr:hypothetical protein D4764_14G0006390 [Takifugu flavidus]
MDPLLKPGNGLQNLKVGPHRALGPSCLGKKFKSSERNTEERARFKDNLATWTSGSGCWTGPACASMSSHLDTAGGGGVTRGRPERSFPLDAVSERLTNDVHLTV